MAAYKTTGAIFAPGEGVGSAFSGSSALPRSIVSDGRRWVLALHVLVHVIALSANIAACVFFLADFDQIQMKTGSIVAVAMHGLGILAMLALAAAELKQIAFTVGLSLIYSFLLSALLATVAMAVFTFRSDDLLTEQHWLFYTSIYFQTLGLAMVLVCSLNLSANGDVAIDASSA